MSAHPRIRMLLVDDHALFRRALANLIRAEPDFEVAGEAADGIEAVAQAAALRPDVILMDMRMPHATGPEATRRILETTPDAKIVMLTVSDDEDGIFDAVKSGARGYLLKTIEPPTLFDALRGVVRGEAALSTDMAAKILLAFTPQAHRPAAAPACPDLIPRDQEIIAMVADGKTNKEIATALGLAEATVKNHLKTLLATLHLENRVGIAVFALGEHGAHSSKGPVPRATTGTAAPSAGSG
jgi:DNA-binding NarL/FixJ family response regulator